MVVCRSSSLNVAYEMGAYGLPLRATEEFVVFSFALPLSVALSVSVAITAPEPPTWRGMAYA
jgi:hypothetical protein